MPIPNTTPKYHLLIPSTKPYYQFHISTNTSQRIIMSDNIPFEIQVEIMKKLPIKSLVQFRSVSKPWKSLIDSSEFITKYHLARHAQRQQHHLLVSYKDPEYHYYQKYVSIVDDNDTFSGQKFLLTVPLSVRPFKVPIIVSSQGLLCLYNICSHPLKTVVIWNPAIRKSVSIVVPTDLHSNYETVVGFGVRPDTCDPMLVKVMFGHSSGASDTVVEVFTLSTNVWRTLSVNLPRKSVVFIQYSLVVIDRFIYWVAYDWINKVYLIMSFDMITEEFTEVCLPDSLARDFERSFHISTLRESLVVVRIDYGGDTPVCVWMMEDSVPKSFRLLYTIKAPDRVRGVLVFRKSGEPIIKMRKDGTVNDDLFVYEPLSEHVNRMKIPGVQDPGYVWSYTETLLLLDKGIGNIA